jgi:hypothetical protein
VTEDLARLDTLHDLAGIGPEWRASSRREELAAASQLGPRRVVVPSAERLVDSKEAAEALGVPAAQIYVWKSRHQVTEADSIRGRGRAGRIPLYRLADLEPLAEEYRARRATRRDGPT